MTKTGDEALSAMKIFGKALSRNSTTRLTVGCLAVLLLVVGVNPSWGEEGTGTPLALGYINSDGQTGLVEFAAAEPLQGDVVAATELGIPAEPQAHQLVRLTNGRRASQGLPPLKAASELMNSSQYHSNWMANHNCFSHNCPGEPDWVQRIINGGYVDYVLLGENIAAGYTSANGAVQAWMESPGHRANMLNPDFREAGGGYAYSAASDYLHYWTMDYGARNDAQGYPVLPVVINDEAWSTCCADVQLYVYGQGWADQMRFSNDGVKWSDWQPFSSNKTWTLSPDGGSPAVVYAQVRRGSTVLASSDGIYVDLPLTVVPTTMVFLWPKGSLVTTPADYGMNIDTYGGWTANPDQGWIKLSKYTGTGPATVTVYLQGFPTQEGTYSGTITVESLEMVVEVQVTLVVTSRPLEEGHVPLLAKG